MLKNYVTRIILLYSMLTIISSCSSDDVLIPANSFLDKYAGIIWESDDSNSIPYRYFRFNKSITNPYDDWINYPEDCYSFYSRIDNANPGQGYPSRKIVINSNRKLLIKIGIYEDVGCDPCYYYLEFSVQGEVLSKAYLDENRVKRYVVLFIKSDLNPDNIPLCD